MHHTISSKVMLAQENRCFVWSFGAVVPLAKKSRPLQVSVKFAEPKNL